MIQVYNKKEEYPSLWVIECPECKSILASASDLEYLPQFSTCNCDENLNIKEWYKRNYPDDVEVLKYLRDCYTLKDVWRLMQEGYDAYNIIFKNTFADSLVRESIFKGIAKEQGITYDTVYKVWIGN